jgi:hypothetical protein
MKIEGQGDAVVVYVDWEPIFVKEMEGDVLEFSFEAYDWKITVHFTGGSFSLEVDVWFEDLEINGWVVNTSDAFEIKYQNIATVKFERINY